MKIYSSSMEVLSVIVTMFLLTVSGEENQGNLVDKFDLCCNVRSKFIHRSQTVSTSSSETLALVGCT